MLSSKSDRLLETEGYVFSYWVDAPVKRVIVVEIERDE